MAVAASSRPRVRVDGKFFRLGEKKFYVKGLAYGPFAPNAAGQPFASPEQTAADGSYSFTGLAAGTYQIQVLPSANVALGILSPGSAGGDVGTDEIQVKLAPGMNATDYNFAILGAQVAAVERGTPEVFVPRWIAFPVRFHGGLPRLFERLARRSW